MPKIFLIKDRLHQQQLRLQESQNLIQAKNVNHLNIGDSNERTTSKQQQREDTQEPLSLVAKKRNNEGHPESLSKQRNSDCGKYKNHHYAHVLFSPSHLQRFRRIFRSKNLHELNTIVFFSPFVTFHT